MLSFKINETMRIIRKAKKESGNIPIILNFSGGKDSLLLLNLVKKVTDDFICFYCVTKIEFPETVESVKETAKELEIPLLFSYPNDHKGSFFKRLKQFRYFPLIKNTWCSRDLKWRPQKKVLMRFFGNKTFYKLNAVRKYESVRRTHIYHKNNVFFWKDYDVSKDLMVFPILNWTTNERDNYLLKNKIKIRTNPLYKKYKVSGCYWCPFYQASIYRRILSDFPNLYDKVIDWEIRLNKPSVSGKKWLRDLKDEMVHIKRLDHFLYDSEKLEKLEG
ncbi:MAG: phosphoadenosine phosphosulfate reductase family protein [Candidatus Hodarchaeota archaeon]